MEASDFKKALTEVLNSLEINVNLVGTLSFNVKDNENPVEPSVTPSVTPSMNPSVTPSVTPPADPPVDPDHINVIFKNDFEHYTLGKWDMDEIRADFWQYPSRLEMGGARNNFVDVVDFEGTRCLRARMPYNADSTYSGFDIYSSLNPNDRFEEIYISYNMFFPDDFRSAHGGKLPGITSLGMPGEIYTYNGDPYNPRSGNIVCGLYKGNHGPEEIKWYTFLKYPPENESPYGHMSPDGPYWTNTFGNGAWHNVTLRMTHSSPSVYDGLCEVFIDGVLSDSWQDRCTRIEPNQVWDQIRFQHFTNHSSEQTDDTNYYSYVDDLLVFNYDGNTVPNIPKGKVPSEPGRVLQIPNWPKQ